MPASSKAIEGVCRRRLATPTAVPSSPTRPATTWVRRHSCTLRAFAPDEGENIRRARSARYPGAHPRAKRCETDPARPTESNDLYIRQEKYHEQFAEETSRPEQTALMAVGPAAACGRPR